MVKEVQVDINENIGIPRGFITIPERILGMKELNPTDKLVYARIVGFEEYFESQEHCAEFLGISMRAVGEAKRKLEKLNLIICIENTGRGKVYKAILDQDFQNLESRLPKSGTQTSKKRNSDFQNLEIYNKDNNKEYKKEYINQESVDSDTQKKNKKELPKEAYDLADHLRDKILQYQPTACISKNYREKWALEIEKAHRIDGRKWEALWKMIDYCYDVSDFWCQNIRSGDKLRKHYDRLESEMISKFLKGGTMIAGQQGNEDEIYTAPF